MSNSRSVNSNQAGIHENLDKLVVKHIQSSYQKPIQAHNLEAFDHLTDKLKSNDYQRIILDSCCGTAMSTFILAEQNSDALVIGLDRSFARLNKQNQNGAHLENCLLLRANCEDIWRLCIDHGIVFNEHHILYPNPYPKSVHLKRRWHGHPVFPILSKLAKFTRLRSNWLTYLEEYARAWELVTQRRYEVSEVKVTQPLTLFEKKYAKSSQPIYEWRSE